MGQSLCYINLAAEYRDTGLRIFYENGTEIPIERWEDVVHAGMVAVVGFIPHVTEGRKSKSTCSGMSQSPLKGGLHPDGVLGGTSQKQGWEPTGTSEENQTFLSAMTPPGAHKSVSLERYPSSKLYSQNRPANIRIHSLPPISEQSNLTSNDGLNMFPRSITPLPSPQPWKVLFSRAKSRIPEKTERDYFSSRPVQTTAIRKWSEPSWVSTDEAILPTEDIIFHHSVDAAMDIDMNETDEPGERTQLSLKDEHLGGGIQYPPPTVEGRSDCSNVHTKVFGITKRKRGYGTDSEDDGEDICRRRVKRTIVGYHCNQLHGVLQAV